jgi:hypothetical protein
MGRRPISHWSSRPRETVERVSAGGESASRCAPSSFRESQTRDALPSSSAALITPRFWRSDPISG